MGEKESVTPFTDPDELERRKAVLEFIAQFKELLRTSKNKDERESLRTTIQNWEATL